MFDFKKAIAKGKAQIKNPALNLLLLGPSGAGKSGTAGTFGGPVLFFYTAGESHGPVSASAHSDGVLPIQYDKDPSTGEMLDADEAYGALLDYLDQVDKIKETGIVAVVVDGISELETIIMRTEAWDAQVEERYKGNASYAGPVTTEMLAPVYNRLATLREELGVHTVMTGILDVKAVGDAGEIVQATPTLNGYNVAAAVVRAFGDILIIGQMKNPKTGTMAPRIQFAAAVQRTTADFKTKEVRKILNVHNRLSGVDMTQAPRHLPADLSKIVEIKKQGKFTPSK